MVFTDKKYKSSIAWIVFAVIVWYVFISTFLQVFFDYAVTRIDMSDSLRFVTEFYTATISSVVVLFLLTWSFRNNRYIWKSLLPASGGSAASGSPDDITAEYYGRGRNRVKALLLGLLLGFGTNFFAIACALIHGDIKLYYDFSAADIPLMIFALLSVFIQSASEEMWCRGFMYERIHERHPLWVVFAVNGAFFGLLHAANTGVTVLSIVSIIICGISYSILRWYSGNIWIAFGVHTGWNFMQNFICGLPNSGLVSEVSIFHMGAANGISNLIYDYGFGVEGALPAIFADTMIAVICLLLAKRDGRLGELRLSRRDRMEETA